MLGWGGAGNFVQMQTGGEAAGEPWGAGSFPAAQPRALPHLGNDRGSEAVSTGAITAWGEMNNLANQLRTSDFFFYGCDSF